MAADKIGTLLLYGKVYYVAMGVGKILQALMLTGFVFGVLGFVYIMGNAWFHPESLSWPLTHFRPYPREDTFAVFCFVEAMGCFFVYNLLKR